MSNDATTTTNTAATINFAPPDFERASRLKLRFDSPVGQLSVEDLWDLPLTSAGRANLDSIAIVLHGQCRAAADVVSFVETARGGNDDECRLRFEIVLHVIAVKLAERDRAKSEADRRAAKQRLLELIERKQDEQLAGKSIDELRAMVEEL